MVFGKFPTGSPCYLLEISLAPDKKSPVAKWGIITLIDYSYVDATLRSAGRFLRTTANASTFGASDLLIGTAATVAEGKFDDWRSNIGTAQRFTAEMYQADAGAAYAGYMAGNAVTGAFIVARSLNFAAKAITGTSGTITTFSVLSSPFKAISGVQKTWHSAKKMVIAINARTQIPAAANAVDDAAAVRAADGAVVDRTLDVAVEALRTTGAVGLSTLGFISTSATLNLNQFLHWATGPSPTPNVKPSEQLTAI